MVTDHSEAHSMTDLDLRRYFTMKLEYGAGVVIDIGTPKTR
jgi:hypothetical protein